MEITFPAPVSGNSSPANTIFLGEVGLSWASLKDAKTVSFKTSKPGATVLKKDSCKTTPE